MAALDPTAPFIDEATATWLEQWGLVLFGIAMGTAGALWLTFEEFRHRRTKGVRMRERLRQLLQLLVAALETKEAKAHADHLRMVSANAAAFEAAKSEVFGRIMGPVCHKCGVDLHWMDAHLPYFTGDPEIADLATRLGKLCSLGVLGPLAAEKGRCVVVNGLEGDASRLNGEKGVLKSYAEEGNTYEVGFILREHGSVNVSLPASSVALLDNEEMLESVQQQQLAVLALPEIQAIVNRLREECRSLSIFLHRREGLDSVILKPIYERHGVDAKWYAYMVAAVGNEKPEVRERAKLVEDLLSYRPAGYQEVARPGAEEEDEALRREPVQRRPLEERARVRPRRQLWEVVGGGDDGIPVMVGSEEGGWTTLPQRLKAGAIIAELALDGSYCEYSKLLGSGPSSGWVDVSLEGKATMVKTSKKPPEVWLLCLGTRGDFQPYAALAKGLQRAGFSARMLGPENQEGFSDACGLPFTPICPDVEGALRAHMERPDATDDLLGRLIFQDFDHELLMHEVGVAKPDVLLYGPLCDFWALNVERKFGVPAVRADLQPQGLEGSMPGYTEEAAKESSRRSWEQHCQLEESIVRPAYGVAAGADMGFERYYKRTIKEGRLVGFFASLGDFLHSLPRHVQDVQKRHSYTGFWFLGAEENPDAVEGTEQMEAVERFLKVGPAVYIGWGSCVCAKGPAHMVTIAVGALKQAGVRGIVLAGWAGLTLELLSEAVGPEDPNGLREYAAQHVLFVRRVSHSWLFPKCACHVHHGGVGTLAASWRTGRPVVVTPIWMDQFMNAELVKFMCGIATPPLDDLTAADLAKYISRTMTDLGVLGTASMLAQSVHQEDGVKKGVEYVSRLMKEEVQSGRWHRRWKASGYGWRDDWGMQRYV